VGLALLSLAGQSTRRLAILVLIDAAALNARCCFNTFDERPLVADWQPVANFKISLVE